MNVGRIQKQSGQIALVLVLVLSVVMVVVLSIMARQVSDVSVSTSEDASVRAFSAAEAGIESNLGTFAGTFQGATGIPSASITGSITIGEEATEFNLGQTFGDGEVATIWLAPHTTTGLLSCDTTLTSGSACRRYNRLHIAWGDPNDSSFVPAIETSLYYIGGTSNTRNAAITSGDYSRVKVGRGAYDINADSRGNNFWPYLNEYPNCSIMEKSYRYCVDIYPGGFSDNPVAQFNTGYNGMLFLRIRFITYGSTKTVPFGISNFSSITGMSSYPFPPQGRVIESSAQVTALTRKISADQGYPEYPTVLDYGVFSYSGGITK